MYIIDADDWAELCASDPRWVAESLQRIGRFGGQHPTANVLNHSLEVAYMLQKSSPAIRLWALYHDAHEILTGDVPRKYKNEQLKSEQTVLDSWLQAALGISVVCDTVEKMDVICGNVELVNWGIAFTHYTHSECVNIFEIRARSLMAILAATRNPVSCPQ